MLSIPLLSLLIFAAWTLLLVGVIASFRTLKVLLGRSKANDFPADEPHGGDAYRRLLRAHINCAENLPVYGAIVLTAAVAGIHSSLLDYAAITVIAARIAQSMTHIISTSHEAVMVRFTFFLVQYAAMAAMIVQVISGAAPGL